ncbi:hypothetical protein [Arenimonas sp.]|uniref:hypothetical protein n=1 Tax=Arenimonas sp. TaxID=1872635 RepID=UPI0039E5F011
MLAVGLLTGTTIVRTQFWPDVVVVDGQRQGMITKPLIGWLNTHAEQLERASDLPLHEWRDHASTWRISEGKLWLRKVEIWRDAGDSRRPGRPIRSDVIERLFPDSRNIVASWYTGALVLPKNFGSEPRFYFDDAAFERYTVVWVRSGEVTRRLDLSREQFAAMRKERFAAWRGTESYHRNVTALGWKDPTGIDEYLFSKAMGTYLAVEPVRPVH